MTRTNVNLRVLGFAETLTATILSCSTNSLSFCLSVRFSKTYTEKTQLKLFEIGVLHFNWHYYNYTSYI